MKIKINITLLTVATLLFSACATKEPTKKIDEKKEYELKQKASQAIQRVAGSIQMKLYEKVKEGGMINAASFCSTNATTLAKNVVATLPKDIKLKRITDKPRNIKNQASNEEQVVLDEIKTRLKAGENLDMLIKQKTSNHYQVYKPIKIMGACLRCHGTAQTRDEKAYDVIVSKYPEDKAINYKLYELRGAFLIDIIQ